MTTPDRVLTNVVIITPRMAYKIARRVNLEKLIETSAGEADQPFTDTITAVLHIATVYATNGTDVTTPRNSTEPQRRSKHHYTPKDVARQLRLTPHAIRAEIRKGHLPATRAGRSWHIAPDDYRRYLERKRNT